MSLVVVLAAVVIAFLAFRFIAGMVKWVLVGGILVVAAVIAHQSGAF